jgi:hypothetical protein
MFAGHDECPFLERVPLSRNRPQVASSRVRNYLVISAAQAAGARLTFF